MEGNLQGAKNFLKGCSATISVMAKCVVATTAPETNRDVTHPSHHECHPLNRTGEDWPCTLYCIE